MGANVKYTIDDKMAAQIMEDFCFMTIQELTAKYSMSYPTMKRKLKQLGYELKKNRKAGELVDMEFDNIRVLNEYRYNGTLVCKCRCLLCDTEFTVSRQKLLQKPEQIKKCTYHNPDYSCDAASENSNSMIGEKRKTVLRQQKLYQALRIKSRRNNLQLTKKTLLKTELWDSEKQLDDDIHIFLKEHNLL